MIRERLEVWSLKMLSMLLSLVASYSFSNDAVSIKNGPLYINDTGIVVGQQTSDECKGGIVQVPGVPGMEREAIPEKVEFNKEKEQANPLLGKSAKRLVPLHHNSDASAIVLREYPASIFIKSGKGAYEEIVTIPSIPDALGKETPEIVELAYAAVPTKEYIEQYLVAIVQGEDKEIYGSSGGIVLIKNQPLPQEEPEVKDKFSAPVLFRKGTWGIVPPTKEGLPQALSIDVVHAGLSINNGLASLNAQSASMLWMEALDHMFIGFIAHTKEDATEDQGACALMLARVVDSELHIDPIMPYAPFGTEGILSARGPGKRVAVHKMAIMGTTMHSPYLVLVGGQGSEEETMRSVYALPLFIESYEVKPEERRAYARKATQEALSSTIASKRTPSHLSYADLRPIKMINCSSIPKPMEYDEDPYKPTDLAVKVGGGPAHGVITDIKAVEDAVFISVVSSESAKSGIFYSQAILSSEGLIVNWTPWQRYAGISSPVIGFHVPKQSNDIWYLMLDNNGTDTMFFARTSWDFVHKEKTESEAVNHQSQGSSRRMLSEIIEHFDEESKGIIRWQEYHNKESDNDNSAMIIALGSDKVVLATWDNNLQEKKPLVVALQDAVLQEIGPLSYASMVRIHDHYVLMVGGTRGCAVLVDNQAQGWDATSLPADWLKAISAHSMKCTKINDMNFVKKIIQQGNALYILTDDQLVRAELKSAEKGGVSVLSKTILACRQVYGGMFDIVIEGNVALLATTKGLFRNAIGTNIATVGPEVEWDQVPLPQEGAVSNLFLVKGGTQDCISHAQVYALVNNYAHRTMQVYRFSLCIDYSSEAKVGETTLQRMWEDKNGSLAFVSFNSSRTSFFTDGFNAIVGMPMRGQTPACALALPLKDRILLSSKPIACKQLLLRGSAQDVVSIMNSALLETILVVGEHEIIFAK